MVCFNCKVENQDDHTFCINCGEVITKSGSSQVNTPNDYNTSPLGTGQQNYGTSDSVETSVIDVNQNQQSVPNFNPPMPNSGAYPSPAKKQNWLLLIGIPLILLLVIGGGAMFLLSKQNVKTENLPENFGLYFQNEDKNKLVQIKKMDVSNVLDTKKEILEDDNLPKVLSKPNLIFYNEDISVGDLKLIEIDSIKDDGSFRKVEFQAAKIEGKSDMKKIRTEKELAKGKYAFALFDGDFDDGKHKLWVFEIKKSGKSDNDELANSDSISLKPTPEKPKVVTVKEVPAPPGSSVSYVTQGSVVMRSSPSQNSSALGKFKRGQKVYIIEYSSNREVFHGKSGSYNSNFALVQTTTGKKGWIYSAFLK